MRNCRECGKQRVSTKTGPATCPTCRREKYRIVKQRYTKSPKGIATARAREQRPEVKEKRNKYSATIQAKLNKEKYLATPKGMANSRKKVANYRARLRKAEGIVTAQDWMGILARHHYLCFYCNQKSFKMTLDHVIPLSKGGRNSPENIVPACHKCNCTKRDKIGWK